MYTRFGFQNKVIQAGCWCGEANELVNARKEAIIGVSKGQRLGHQISDKEINQTTHTE